MLDRLLRPPIVLAYHGVAEGAEAEDPDRLLLDPTLFERQLRMLVRRGYRFTTASEALEEPGGRPAAGTAVLTFDDGWLDALTEVVPLLRRVGASATFYVCPGWLGGHHPLVAGPAGRLLDAGGVRELRRHGMEVASHSMLHRDLRKLSDDELSDDLVTSKAAVEELIDGPCRTFAYPYGLSDTRVEEATVAAGYELAFAWSPGPWRAASAPRLPAPPRHGPLRLALKMVGVRRRVA